jgi:hypothetical protein
MELALYCQQAAASRALYTNEPRRGNLPGFGFDARAGGQLAGDRDTCGADQEDFGAARRLAR